MTIPHDTPRSAARSFEGATVAILLAAGGSTRMAGEDKLWADLGGAPLIASALRTLAGVEEMDALVVVAPAGHHAELYRLGTGAGRQVVCVEGGARRRDSVHAALEAAPGAAWYLVHDGARPLATGQLVRRVLDAVRTRGAVVPGLPVADTIKRVDGLGVVQETLPRAELRAIQTPQAFAGDILRRAHALDDGDATDDAALVERLGAPVHVVDGEAANLKVTTPDDLERVRTLLAGRG
ncbi:MAG: 2-C-methyl-D-erythritol 4-phosphate cytidylyltransferase [Dehalococcoidia bacterium]|nr:2-C-methyl-D-erythritol 4-phosphate cytidylyltransferase [Dehalococcoidia bacterium]